MNEWMDDCMANGIVYIPELRLVNCHVESLAQICKASPPVTGQDR